MLLDEIEAELDLGQDAEPLIALRCLADYLQQVGYVREIAVHPLSEDVW